MSKHSQRIQLNIVVPAVLLCTATMANVVSAAPAPVPTPGPVNPVPPVKPADIPPAKPAERPADKPADVPSVQEPCGVLTRMGKHTSIYNNSRYAWNVVFTTHRAWLPLFRFVNAGVVKYQDNGKWIDAGYGNNQKTMEYKIPVPAGKTVPIAYCADKSYSTTLIEGGIEFFPADATYSNGRPGNGITFYASNGRSGGETPIFTVNAVTPYVNYNRNNATKPEDGSVTICPNDPECKVP